MNPIIVLDTNIYISSIFWNGGPYIIIKKAINQEFFIYISEYILYEIRKVLGRDFNLHKQEIDDILSSLHQFTHVIEPKERIEAIKEDPDDDKILECAVACRAKYILSYNNHLLKLKEFRRIKILTPKEFLSLNNI